MAHPPSASLPLPQRAMAIARTLQFGWFLGHLTLLLTAIRYALSYVTFNYYSKRAMFCYRLAFLSAASTYGIVVYKAYRARMRSQSKQQGSQAALLGDENVQYLAMALIWLFSRQIPLAILPFAIYSVFHVATYSRSILIPTFMPPSQTNGAAAAPGAKPQPGASPIADAIGKFIKDYYDSSMGLVAMFEVFIWLRLLMSLLTFSRGAIFLFVAYSAFLRARYAQSSFVQSTVSQLRARIDASVASQGTPPAVRQGWNTFKGLMTQAADLTDINRYIGRPQPAPKKAQ